MKKIIIIYKNKEIIRDAVSVSTDVSVLKSYFETLVTKTDINPDKDQVTVWVGDTHLYIAYRLIKKNFIELTVINNLETFNFIVNETGMFAEDMDGIGYRIETISDFTQACGIE